MDIKVKTAVIIISTLLIGIIVGFMGSRLIMHGRMKFIDDKPLSARFHKSLMRIIRPTEQQGDTVGVLLDSYTERFDSINQGHRLEMESLIDSLYYELLPLLNEKQQKRLTQRKKTMSRKQKEMQRKRGERRKKRSGP